MANFFWSFKGFMKQNTTFKSLIFFMRLLKIMAVMDPDHWIGTWTFEKYAFHFKKKNPILLLLGTFDLDSNLTRTLIELYFRCMIIFQNAVFNNWILIFFSIFSYAKIENMGLDIPLFCIHLRWVESLNLVKNNICILLDFFFSSALKVRDMNL